MSCLWGLPITGDPVTGITDSASIQGRLYDLLGIKDHEIKGLMKKRGNDANERTSDILVSKKALRERFLKLPNNATEQELKWLVFFYLKSYSYFIFSIMYSHSNIGD